MSGCLSLYQLQRLLRLVPPQGQRIWVERLVTQLDELGLDVCADLWHQTPDPLLLISEAVWQQYWAIEKVCPEANDDEHTPSTEGRCLNVVSELATNGIWYVAQLSGGARHWLSRTVQFRQTARCLKRFSG